MQKIRAALIQFMRGRYGTNDSIQKLLLVVYLALILLNVLFRSHILSLAALAIFAVWLFRLLSKNIPARAKEDLKFKRAKSKLDEKIKLLKNRWKDRKTHVYRNCPCCKSVIRLPRKKGSHSVICPCCRQQFKVVI